MAPIIATLVSMFASEGLDLVSSALQGGKEKAKEFIEEKTGLDLNKPQELTKEDIAEIKKLEDQHAKELAQLALEKLKEENRHEEAIADKEVEDRINAREMFKHGSDLQSSQAKAIMSQTKWQIPIYMVLNAAVIFGAKVYNIDPTAVVAVSNLIGIGIKSAYDERAQVNSFLFGSMIAKVKKKEDK